MAGWTRCPHCNLAHSARADGACPRCRRPIADGPAFASAPAGPHAGPAAAVRAAPAPAFAPVPAQFATSAPSLAPAAAPFASAAAPPAGAPSAPPAAASPGGGAKSAPKWSAANVAGLLVGVGISRAFGAALLFPALFGGLAAVILGKAGPARARPFTAAASVVIGHTGWMIVGALAVGSFGTVGVDIVLMAAGVAWLLAAPGAGPAIALAVYEAVGIVVNLGQLADAQGALVKALVLHLLLRVGAIAALVAGWVAHRKGAGRLPVAATARVFE
jgi:hypothetical protein